MSNHIDFKNLYGCLKNKTSQKVTKLTLISI